MLNIIICEDDSRQRKKVEDIVIDELKSSKLNMNIDLSTDRPKEVIKYIETCKGKTFIYFLDVELGNEINGLELAKQIRKYDPAGYVIFITSHAEMSLLPFQYKVQAMDFIIKFDINSIDTRIRECINAAYKDYENLKTLDLNIIPITFGSRIINFNLNDILFFETTSRDHRLRIHTCEEQLEFYGTLKEMEKLVPSYYYKCHRSYLINTKKIKEIDKDKLVIRMINDEICYATSRYLKGLLKNV